MKAKQPDPAVTRSIALRDIEALCAVACQTCARRGPWVSRDFPQCPDCRIQPPRIVRPGDPANLPISTPQAPAGCSCTKCLTWARLFPELHAQWLQFADREFWTHGRGWWRHRTLDPATGEKVPTYEKDWNSYRIRETNDG